MKKLHWINEDFVYYHQPELMKSIKRVWDKIQPKLIYIEILSKYPINKN